MKRMERMERVEHVGRIKRIERIERTERVLDPSDPASGVGPGAGRHERFRESQGASGRYLAHLIACSLRGWAPACLPKGASWRSLFSLARRNGVEASAWPAVSRCVDVPKEVVAAWREAADLSLYRLLRFEEEREGILRDLKAAGIACLPLKGIILAGYYPDPGMRSMSDNDILYGFVEAAPEGGFRIRGADDASRNRSVREALDVAAGIMRARGYRAESLKVGNHDTFLKEPCYNFELHRRLVSAGSAFSSYYDNPWRRAKRVEGDPLAFRFSDEDEYVYLLVHAFKHFDVSGCGIRFLVDQQVFLEAKGEGLDWPYVAGELEAVGLTGFERWTRELARAAFGNLEAVLTENEERRLLYLLECGTYGSVQVRTERGLGEVAGRNPRFAKARYALRRVFPDKDHRRTYAPVFVRHPALMPLYPFYRLGKGVRKIVRDPKALASEVRALLRAR